MKRTFLNHIYIRVRKRHSVEMIISIGECLRIRDIALLISKKMLLDIIFIKAATHRCFEDCPLFQE